MFCIILALILKATATAATAGKIQLQTAAARESEEYISCEDNLQSYGRMKLERRYEVCKANETMRTLYNVLLSTYSYKQFPPQRRMRCKAEAKSSGGQLA